MDGLDPQLIIIVSTIVGNFDTKILSFERDIGGPKS